MSRSPGSLGILLASVATLALLNGALMAQETTDPAKHQGGFFELLGRITLFADRIGTAVLDVPANITVVTGAELDSHAVTDMQEMTRYTPGVTVQRQTTSTDPFQSFGGFNIRGVGGNRVQMQVDGSRVAERITDGTRNYLDFDFTKQVDIVRGPASVLWGSDALGGVVALTTLDPEDVLQGRSRGGTASASFDSLNQGTNVSAVFAQKFSDQVSMLLGVKREQNSEAELSNARADGGIWGCPRLTQYGVPDCGTLNPLDQTTNRVLGKIVWSPNSENRLEFSADLMARDTNVDYRTPLTALIHSHLREMETKRDRYALEHTWTPENGVFDSVKTTLAYSPQGYDRHGVRRSTNSSGQSIVVDDYLNYSEDFLELDIQATKSFTTGTVTHELVFGFDGDHAETDYERKDVTVNNTTGTTTEVRGSGFNFANATTKRADIYLQDKITLGGGAIEITPGMRYATFSMNPRPNPDYIVVPGEEPTRRKSNELLKSLGATWHIDNTYQVWAHYGEGFKMPTAQQLYTSLPSFGLVPSPNLLPEEVKSVELGFRGEYERGFFSVTGFQSDYTNFIESFYEIAPDTYTNRNLSSVKIWGIEASGAYQFNDALTANVTASWQRGNQKVGEDSAKTPTNLPPLTAIVGLTYDMPQRGLSFEAVGTFASGVKETSSPDNFQPDGYGILDLYAHWDVTETGRLNVGIKNVFDKRYFAASAASYGSTATAAVAAANPLELQTGAGRVFTVSYDMTF